MKIERDETAQAYVGEAIHDFASITARQMLFKLAFLSNLAGCILSFVSNFAGCNFSCLSYFVWKRLDMFMLHWNCVFRTQLIHDLHLVHYCSIQIKCAPFQKKLSFAVAICCLIFL